MTFLMNFGCEKSKLTLMQCNMVKTIWTFCRMKLRLLLHFYGCQGITKLYIKIFIGQMNLAQKMKQSHVQWAEIDFERYYHNFIWLATHRLQKIDTTKYEYYLKSWISISSSMVHLLITALMKVLSLTMKNTAQNLLLEGSPVGVGSNVCASHHLKDISFMENHIVE